MLLAGLRLRLIVVIQPDAPCAFRKAGISGVVLEKWITSCLRLPQPCRHNLAGAYSCTIENSRV